MFQKILSEIFWIPLKIEKLSLYIFKNDRNKVYLFTVFDLQNSISI